MAGHDADLALLAGDYLYALGIERLAASGDTRGGARAGRPDRRLRAAAMSRAARARSGALALRPPIARHRDESASPINKLRAPELAVADEADK